VLGWGYFIYTGTVATIWPMFGMANQLLALIALTIVTAFLRNSGRSRYAAVTVLPACFVACTTLTTAYLEITGTYYGWIRAGDMLKGVLNIGLTLLLVTCVAVIMAGALRGYLLGSRKPATADAAER
jgi:carbon starvation protein